MTAATTSTKPAIQLKDPVSELPGLGPGRVRALARLGVKTVADLIKHLPHRYEYQHGHTAIGNLPTDVSATTTGTILSSRWVPMRGGQAVGRSRGGQGRFLATIADASGRLDLVFFNASYLRDKLHPGGTVTVTGKVALYRGSPQMVNPQLRLSDGSTNEPPVTQPTTAFMPRYRPIYPATEEMSSEQLERLITAILPNTLPLIEDHLDNSYRSQRILPILSDAYRKLHQPADEEEVTSALRRLAYDELLLLQLGFALKRRQVKTELAAPPLRWSEAIDEHIRHRFPFTLTDDQSRVTREIADDLRRDRPMNRLLQGDVGSGKTVVALYALLMAAASGKQGAILAPTELLAEQHYSSIARMLEGSTVRIALLTGSLTDAERTSVLYRLERGKVDILIGTHSILTGSVRFAGLAVVVVDEQHRFGVIQRAAARSKATGPGASPHTLVMTATPIPRTLGLGLFGDLDISTITHPPLGRKPITTRVTTPEKSEAVYTHVAERIGKGEQAYIVLPQIDESSATIKAVRTHAAHLTATHFRGMRVAVLHGRLQRPTRERIMDRFRTGKIDALVATTVIEVGVDVPNASVMVVEHAERFGLAQLHQLRGRVGRGPRKSLCVFIADSSTEDSKQRMKAIASTSDGFQIAEADLAIRGMGEFFGTRQSGLPPLQVADLIKHSDLLQLARRDAQQIVESDPNLSDPSHDLLRKRLFRKYGKAIGLGDVA